MGQHNLKNSRKWIYLYWILLAVAIALEYRYIYPLWRRRELARRTLGIITVMGGAYPLAEAGVIDRRTWWTLFNAFGIAGAITSALHLTRDARAAQRARQEVMDDDPRQLWEAWERRIDLS